MAHYNDVPRVNGRSSIVTMYIRSQKFSLEEIYVLVTFLFICMIFGFRASEETH